jgi:hypothetical protein
VEYWVIGRAVINLFGVISYMRLNVPGFGGQLSQASMGWVPQLQLGGLKFFISYISSAVRTAVHSPSKIPPTV